MAKCNINAIANENLTAGHSIIINKDDPVVIKSIKTMADDIWVIVDHQKGSYGWTLISKFTIN